jgi:hypothetical protein
MTSLNFLFRKPRLPIIIDTGTGLIGATSWPECKRKLTSIVPGHRVSFDVIDLTAEGFAFYPERMAFSPLILKKRWTKAAIIALYNNAREPGRPAYPATSLSNKSLGEVVKAIVDLLDAEQATGASRPKTK